jgi:uncharacterized protein with von Willebrand factor type A (vWA) domain
MADFGVKTVVLDLPPLVAAFSRRLRDAGLPVGADHAARFARALIVTGRRSPLTRRRLYWTARAVFVSDPSQVRAFDSVFADAFGRGGTQAAPGVDEEVRRVPPAAGERHASEPRSPGTGGVPSATAPRRGHGEPGAEELPVPLLASDEEALRGKRFDALDPDELAAIYRLMGKLVLATPWRRTRRAEPWRHGSAIDMRRTLRGSLRTGGDPVRLARRRRRIMRRRLVLLCDISGSMEPYARAYLQFLTCAAQAGAHTEAFAFATRLTRLTRALHSRNPERAIQRAAATAPDWSSGTRIGDALQSFNDRHGRRGMARGAVVVILSDGWERGDPALVTREMERLSRLAHRIVWVNPRVAAAGFAPRAGGMAAALPFCDALVSGHTLAALEEVVAAIADEGVGGDVFVGGPGFEPPPPAEDSWPSATPLPGSSVAMPSGYGPSRGRTTPGWGTSR